MRDSRPMVPLGVWDGCLSCALLDAERRVSRSGAYQKFQPPGGLSFPRDRASRNGSGETLAAFTLVPIGQSLARPSPDLS